MSLPILQQTMLRDAPTESCSSCMYCSATSTQPRPCLHLPFINTGNKPADHLDAAYITFGIGPNGDMSAPLSICSLVHIEVQGPGLAQARD